MGRIIYNPKEKEIRDEDDGKQVKKSKKSNRINQMKKMKQIKQEEQILQENEKNTETVEKNFNHVRVIGEKETEYQIYIEDYVYTYLYQYAAIDLTCEHSGAFVGKFYEDTKQVAIWGIIPIPKDKLTSENEWINREVMESLEVERQTYFEGADWIGWMHMQPGYGTMLTMKEIKAHQEVFGNAGKILLLIDPINKIETFFIYEEETFKEQSGYCMYYERNEAMQRYMLEHPLIFQQKEVVEDEVVNQFRQLGKIRKKQYQERKKTNVTVIAASVLILALTAVVVKMSDQGQQLKRLKDNVQTISLDTNESVKKDDGVKFVIETQNNNQKDALPDVEITDDTNSIQPTTRDKEVNKEPVKEVAKEVNKETAKQVTEKVNKEAAKEAPKEVVKEATEETTKKVNNEATKEVAKQEPNIQKDVEYKTYVVQEGDTLLKITYNQYKTESRAKEIIKLNNLKNSDQIYIGQKIKLPIK